MSKSRPILHRYTCPECGATADADEVLEHELDCSEDDL